MPVFANNDVLKFVHRYCRLENTEQIGEEIGGWGNFEVTMQSQMFHDPSVFIPQSKETWNQGLIFHFIAKREIIC